MSYILPSTFLILTVIVLSCNLFDYGNLHSASAVSISTITQMNDTTSSYGLSTDTARSIQAEYVSATSSLVGKHIDTITVKLQRYGSPSGTVQVGVFNNDQSVKQLFGTVDASTVATSYSRYSFSLTAPQTYQIQSGDRIGIKFTGGDSSNFIAIMTDNNNSFDRTNSYQTYYTNAWQSLTGNDLTMILQLHVPATGPAVSSTPPGGTYTSPQSVTLSASAPATIYYTTDGSTPTTSSTNGTSPVMGITISTNSTLKFFAKDSLGNTGSITSAKYTIIYPVVTQMNDTTSSFGLSTDAARSIQAEYISSTSSLVGKSIDTIVTDLRTGGYANGIVQVGIFNSDLSVKQLFGTIDASNILPAYSRYSFSIPTPQTYQIQSGDRIGIKFDSGNSSNFVAIMTDKSDTFDGTNSYQTYYTNAWQSLTGNDLTMILQLHVPATGPAVSSTPPGGTYTSPQSVTLSASRASTIFYTTDGSTPTTSSASSPSPVTGITISTNSTLKFFAKDSLGNTGPIGSTQYTIILPPTVSASPPGGTYSSPQSVTLSASAPATIYYTTDGSTPTTSSTNGTSPVMGITISTNSTLKYFAKDTLGNESPVGSSVYTIVSSPPVDPFGIEKIYPDSPGGMQWYSTTFNIARTNTGNSVDPVDHWLDFSHGNGVYAISNGILSASPQYSASAERIYIHNPDLKSEWHNVEITTYGRNNKMDKSITDWDWSGLMAYGRTNHGTNGNEDINLCDDRGYGGRLLLDGSFDFEKETRHGGTNGYDQKASVPVWSPSDMPLNQWIGYKFIIYDKTINGIKGVQLELWLDKSGTGNWVKMDSYFDNGSDFGLTGSGSACATGVNTKLQLTHSMALLNSETGKPHLSIYYRTDGQWMSYKDMSVREIIPPS